MPISDEVIELAPVKKTKKTLIIMIACMGALLALAVAFLVMYLLKPSVTEDKNHIKDISVVATELFTTDGDGTLYASIGNEYTVYATVTVDDNTSTNIKWECNPDLIERKNTEDGNSFKFVPKVGQHGKTARITAASAVNNSVYKVIEFTIISQGAEDIHVKSWGVTGIGNLTQVKDDNLNKELSITVPFYTVINTPSNKNNRSIRVNFEQFGAYNASSNSYAKLTDVSIDGKKTNGVVVKTKNESDSDYISINADSVDATGFNFTALKSTNNEYVEIQIQANVNNDYADTITKTIKVKVEPNTTLGYVDSFYVFNKPVVDAAFMGRMITNGNTSLISSAAVKSEVAKESLQLISYNDSQVVDSKSFEIVLPYSTNNSITYDDIFKHVMINPANAQYSGGALVENWYKNITALVDDASMLQVTKDSTTGAVKLWPKNVGKCKLTLKDDRSGAVIVIPVRIIAQTTDVTLSVSGNGVVMGAADKTNPDIVIDAGENGKYDVTLTYTFIAPNIDKAEALLEGQCLNNAYKLVFDESEMVVKLKGDTKVFESGKDNNASYKFEKQQGGSNTSTTYKGTFVLEVTVTMNDTGAAVLNFIKSGSDIYGDYDDDKSLKSKDKPVNLSVSFSVKEKATSAKIIEDTNEGLRIVTNDGTRAGNFVRNSDTEACLYVQNQSSGTPLDIVSPEKLKQFVLPDKTYFSLDKIAFTTNSNGLSASKDNIASFSNNNNNPVDFTKHSGTVDFEVLNVNGDSIAKLRLTIYIIDAVTTIKTTESKQTYYKATDGAYITLTAADVQANYSLGGYKNFDYDDVDLYYGNNVIKFGASGSNSEKVKNGKQYTFKYDGDELYVFDVSNRTLTAKTDIYAYSYAKNINFGNVELDFLLKASDEYVGKHTGTAFINSADSRMKLEFIRRADGVAFFTTRDCNSDPISANTDNKFIVSVNQDEDASLYASTIIYIDSNPVYVESVSETKGHIAPVEKATFTMPSRITPVTSDGPQNQTGRYYFVTYHSPTISEEYDKITGATVYFDRGDKQRDLSFVVNNLVRPIKSIGIYSDKAANSALNSLLFGGFINEANKYSNTIYVKVVYETKKDSHTTFESADLILPSYLETADGKTVLVSSKGVKEIDQEIFTCVIKLKKDEATTENKTIEIVPSNHKASGPKAACAVKVEAGLDTLTVKNGETTVATVTAGNTDTYYGSLALQNKQDIKSLSLTFKYTATNSEGYSLPYNYAGAGLKVTYPATVNGLTVESNIKAADASVFTLKINPDNVTTLDNEKITLTFTDEYNGANENNVFTLDIYITVTMDIYDLAYADGTNPVVTVTGAASGNQSFDVTVKYNEGLDTVKPKNETIMGNTVLDVYTFNADENKYKPYTGGITVTKQADGKKYTVAVANNIDRTQTYYLMLKYNNVIPDDKHVRAITINTLTSHLAFDDGNDIKPTFVDGMWAASIVVNSASEGFGLVANVVNDGSGAKESGKIVTYGLYTDVNCETEALGVTINNGVIKFTDPAATTGFVYYLAKYTEENTVKLYSLKVKLTYKIAPSAVSISGLDAKMFNAAADTLTLYYNNNANYTQANLSGKIVVSTAFATASYIPTADATITIALYLGLDSNYLDVTNNVLKPKSIKSDVPVVITATYADVTVTHTYHINITNLAGLSFGTDNGELNLLNKNDTLSVTPTIASDAGFTHAYSLSASDGLFTITGDGDVKTVGFASPTTAKKGGNYKLSATLSYTYSGAANSGITQVGTFSSTAEFTVKVVGEYALKFNLTKDGSAITPYANTDDTKTVIDKGSTYGITVTSDDSQFDATYSATATPGVVSIAAFSGKNAGVTLIENTSGAFAITVTATVGGQTYTCTENYFFMYGDNVSSKLYMSTNNGSTYTEFTAASQSIDYTDTPYKFKYEISGIPAEADVNLVVNGDVTKTALTDGAAGTKYIIITAAKPTTLKVGGSVQIGNRTVYLAEQTVALTATAPAFTLSSNNVESVLPAGTAPFSVGKATGFKGTDGVKYSISSTAYATIDEDTGVLTAKTNVLTDQIVTVTATITVSNGAYAGTYTLNKSITVKGVALPTIAWKDSVVREIGIGTHVYGENTYEFITDVGNYSYGSDSFTKSISVTSSSLTNADYTFSGGTLTIRDTANSRAGGSVTIKVAASITSGPHAGEEVSDTITLRILPTMSTTTDNITLGNAEATYDFNGAAYKSIFAPNTSSGTGFVQSTDKYAVVALSVPDESAANFGTDGAKLIVKNNLTTATTVQVTATVLISSGAYAGTTITGTKTVTIACPTAVDKSFAWNTNKYNTLTLGKSDVLGTLESGATVTSIQVTPSDDSAPVVGITGNGTNEPVIAVDKNSNVYFDTDTNPGALSIPVSYTVTLDNGNVYYSTAQYTVPAQKVTITAKIGEDVVNGLVSVNSNETFIMQLAADKGFDVVVKGVSNSQYFTTVFGGNGVQISTKVVTSNQTGINVTLTLDVAGQDTTFGFKLDILALQSTALYTATNKDNIDFAVNSPEHSLPTSITQNNDVASVWTSTSDRKSQNAQTLVITAPKGNNLSKYFISLSLKLKNGTTYTPSNLDVNSVTIYFDGYNGLTSVPNTDTFTLNMTFNTSAYIPLSTIEVKLTILKGYGSTDIATQYRVQVIGEVPVTLNTNAGDDAVQDASDYSNPLYKHYYNLPTPKRTGYRFDGWFDAEKNGNPVESNATVTKTQPHTLYAHWTANTYAVKYNANYDGAAAISDTKKVTYGQTYGALFKPERAGYDFIGWTEASSENSQVVTANTLVNPTNANTVTEITLYAQWRIQYFTVTLDEDYSDGSVFTFQVPYGQSFNVHNSFRPTREGYRFDGWNVLGDVTNVTSNVTMTARWIKLYTVSFDLNNTESTETYTAKEYDEGDAYGTLPTPANTATKNFTGWSRAQNGNVIDETATVTGDDAQITLYAQWTDAASYTVTFDSRVSGMTAEPASKTVYAGRAYGDLPTLTRVDYTFDGWYTEEDGGDKVESTTMVEITDAQTLYAHWTKVVFTVKLDAGDGKVIGDSRTYITKVGKDQSYDLHLMIVPTRVGYNFDDWYVGNDKQESAITVTGDITLTAHWTANTYTVSFNANGGTDVEDTVSVEYDGTYGTLPTPTRDNYQFDGWYTQEEGGDKVESTTEVKITADQILYAHWKAEYTVTFNYNTGEGATETIETYIEGQCYSEKTIFDNPSLVSGKTFVGWSTDKDATSEEDCVDGNDEVTASDTLYAIWQDTEIQPEEP